MSKFILDIREKFFSVREVRYWSRLAREAVVVLSCEYSNWIGQPNLAERVTSMTGEKVGDL